MPEDLDTLAILIERLATAVESVVAEIHGVRTEHGSLLERAAVAAEARVEQLGKSEPLIQTAVGFIERLVADHDALTTEDAPSTLSEPEGQDSTGPAPATTTLPSTAPPVRKLAPQKGVDF